jgi:hypothetical protein
MAYARSASSSADGSPSAKRMRAYDESASARAASSSSRSARRSEASAWLSDQARPFVKRPASARRPWIAARKDGAPPASTSAARSRTMAPPGSWGAMSERRISASARRGPLGAPATSSSAIARARPPSPASMCASEVAIERRWRSSSASSGVRRIACSPSSAAAIGSPRPCAAIATDSSSAASSSSGWSELSARCRPRSRGSSDDIANRRWASRRSRRGCSRRRRTRARMRSGRTYRLDGVAAAPVERLGATIVRRNLSGRPVARRGEGPDVGARACWPGPTSWARLGGSKQRRVAPGGGWRLCEPEARN